MPVVVGLPLRNAPLAPVHLGPNGRAGQGRVVGFADHIQFQRAGGLRQCLAGQAGGPGRPVCAVVAANAASTISTAAVSLSFARSMARTASVANALTAPDAARPSARPRATHTRRAHRAVRERWGDEGRRGDRFLR